MDVHVAHLATASRRSVSAIVPAFPHTNFGPRYAWEHEEQVMSGTIKFGIIAASLWLTVTLMWGAANLAMLSTLWFGEHPEAAKAMRLLPVLVLPIVAVAIHRRRSRATMSAL